MIYRNIDTLPSAVNELFAKAERVVATRGILHPIDSEDARLYEAAIDLDQFTNDGGIGEAMEDSQLTVGRQAELFAHGVAAFQSNLTERGKLTENAPADEEEQGLMFDTMQPNQYRISPENEADIQVELDERNIVKAIRIWFDKSNDFSDPDVPEMGMLTVCQGAIDVDGSACQYGRDNSGNVTTVWMEESPFEGRLMSLLKIMGAQLDTLLYRD